MRERERYIVQVRVQGRFVRSGNCEEVYATKKEAERAIKDHGVGYMEYRVIKLGKGEGA